MKTKLMISLVGIVGIFSVGFAATSNTQSTLMQTIQTTAAPTTITSSSTNSSNTNTNSSTIPSIPSCQGADCLTYKLDYAKNSKYTSVSLKNATVQLQLFADGNPVGMMTQTTDANQSFIFKNTYDNTLVIALLHIKDQPNNMICQGISTVGQTNIMINCRNK